MNLLLIGGLLILMTLAYTLGLKRSKSLSGEASNSSQLHSRPGYYGTLVALWCGVPAFLLLIIWSFVEPMVARHVVEQAIPANIAAGLQGAQWDALLERLKNIATGYGVADQPQAYELKAAAALKSLLVIAPLAKMAVVFAVAAAGLAYALRKIVPQLRARNRVEKFVKVMLALSSGVAILTTLGIVLSMFTEAIHFFKFVNPATFFFGTEWSPGFSSNGQATGGYGLLPLLWGTLMITIIAMLVAVPIGLMAAIYMAEYATPRFRNFAKPVLEILAGIPTIVYGVFAVLVVGPLLHYLGSLVGININATSALTAGLVMGIMIIPFISSLSDDIIIQVPRSMRDGSLGLGATKSETIKKVVLPAALPGIMGAFLLAVSRAIGETMIVVLAAGNSPLLHGNPFEAVSTITVTIVNQLTGDTDFTSPQALVAFALGLTLFVITLGLNIIALIIVRKYREQYE